MGETGDNLNDRQRAFVDAYLANGFNATQAAIAAGYSPQSARTRGYDLVRNPDIRAHIDAHLEACGASRDKVLQELTDLAFKADMRLFEGLAAGRTLEELHAEGVDTRMVKKLVVRSGEKESQTSVELYDRQRAIEQLAKVMGLEKAEDDSGQSVSILFPSNGPQKVSDADTDE